jgi:hypothetical protein
VIPVTVKTGKRDKFGDRDPNADTVIQAWGFAVNSTSLDNTQFNEQTSRSGTLYVPDGSLPENMGPSTQFVFSEHPGRPVSTWVIDGDTNRWSWPWGGWSPGFEIPLRRVTG